MTPVEWHDDPWSDVFDADYLHFYEEPLEERSDREADLIARLLELEAGAELLDAPCGHGRIANRLAARGFRVVGLDNNPAFLERARAGAAESGVEVEYMVGDIRDLPFSGRFDAAINWFTSFGYFDEAMNRHVLASYRRVLRSGGRLLLEQLHRDFIVRLLPPGGAPLVTLHERGDDLMIDKVTFDLAASRWRTERTVVRDGRVRRVRFSPAAQTFSELRAWLLEASFREAAGYDHAGERLQPDSPRMLVVAHR